MISWNQTILGGVALALVASGAATEGRTAWATQSASSWGASDDRTVPVDVLERRRRRLLQALPEGIAVIRSADPRPGSSHPQDSDFRQDNNFYYLTGLETPGSWLVLFQRAEGPDSVVLFVPGRDVAEEVWTGPRLGAGPEVVRLTGVADVREVEEFEEQFLEPLGRRGAFREFGQVLVPLGTAGGPIGRVTEAAFRARRSVLDLTDALGELRVVKDSAELARLRRAIDITVEAHRAAMVHAEPGMFEFELEAVIEYIFHCNGAERVGFPSIVGSGPNSVILHYDRNRRRTQSGDLVVVDIGAEYAYYTADVTRTFPLSGRFTERQRAIYELVLATQQTVIDSIRPGLTWPDLSRIARTYMREHSEGLCGGEGCDRYFSHGLGHWLGMDVHDPGSYFTPLTPGMVLTVEPGVYLSDEGLGVRIEDDILVTETGHEVLSDGAPRTVEEIEAWMARPSPGRFNCRP